MRYDCAITVNAAHADRDGTLAANGLHLIETEAGRYATITHRGHYELLAGTYDLLCLGWVIPNGYVPGNEPAIELHTVPRHLQDPENIDVTVLFPIE